MVLKQQKFHDFKVILGFNITHIGLKIFFFSGSRYPDEQFPYNMRVMLINLFLFLFLFVDYVISFSALSGEI